jgi:DNA-directed RNA polymerase specialized sigma24 family protein
MAASPSELAVQWATALARGGAAADQATTAAMTGPLGRWIEWRFRQAYRFGEADAEELMADVIFKFSTQPPRSPDTAWGWLTRMVRSTAIDRIRAEGARTPEGGFEFIDGREPSGDGDEAPGGIEVPDWRSEEALEGQSFADCIARQLALMEQKNAKYAALIRMRLEEMENDEMASVVYGVDIDRLTDELMNRFKSMLSTARKVSKLYLEQCKA